VTPPQIVDLIVRRACCNVSQDLRFAVASPTSEEKNKAHGGAL
jgi:hypothetical protein